jgi:hypothetical protein
LLILAALVGDLKSIPSKKQISVVRNIESLPGTINVQASLHDFDGSVNLALPYSVKGSCSLCRNWGELHAFLDFEQLWTEATSHHTLEQALKTKIWVEAQKRGLTKGEQLEWIFGKQFLDTVRSLGFLQDLPKVKILLRACAETVLQKNMRATHALRTGQGANNPQVLRNTDKAWRRDVDAEFHLHYWETKIGIEFSCIVKHNDFDIIY